jgi:hypothetical protein
MQRLLEDLRVEEFWLFEVNDKDILVSVRTDSKWFVKLELKVHLVVFD